MSAHTHPAPYRVITRRDIDRIAQLQRWPEHERTAMKAVSAVLPFRVNNYVLEHLIDWDRVPEDPIFQLTFPQKEMLSRVDFDRMYRLVEQDASHDAVQEAARSIQRRLNPHPAGQLELNVPTLDGRPLPGIQHKYRETVLFFPSQGQTCHAYCTYCFRWAQFVGLESLKFATKEADSLVAYLREHPEVRNVLLTGGDPLIMRTRALRRYVEPLLELEQLTSIRIGTKSPGYWPHRFVTDSDADDLLRLFEEVVGAGKHLALMAHFSHPRELAPPIAQQALQRIRATGAVIRCQAPLIRHVNDDAGSWARMWEAQVRLGAVPYYMFVERDTGPRAYFEVPLLRALEIFNEAYSQVSGLARTVRGPSMSATPGKVLVDGTLDIEGRPHFVLKFLQARDPAWVGKTFLAELDPRATWLDDLTPAFGRERFFFEGQIPRQVAQRRRSLALLQHDPPPAAE